MQLGTHLSIYIHIYPKIKKLVMYKNFGEIKTQKNSTDFHKPVLPIINLTTMKELPISFV